MRFSPTLRRTAYGLWLAGIIFFYALHFAHLLADIPANPVWQDPSNYTDEGWYLIAPAQLVSTGNWYLPGELNFALALPVQPLIMAILFHFTGPGLIAARALTLALIGVALLCNGILVRRHSSLWVALLVLSFVVVSPFFFVFSRVALLEPILLCLLSIAMLLADFVTPAQAPIRRWVMLFSLAVILFLMALTKPTAVSLFPAVLCLLCFRLRRAPRILFASIALIGAVVLTGYGLYAAVMLHSSYRADYVHYYTSASLDHPRGLKSWLRNGQFAIQDLRHFEGWLTALAFIVLAASLLRRFRAIWKDSLFVASVLLVASTTAFVFWRGYHVPHYYLFISLPLATIVSLGFARTVEQANAASSTVALIVLVAVLVVSARQTLAIVRHPTYTFLNMAYGVSALIRQHPSSPQLLVAESGAQITLLTGQPSICDVYGAIPLRTEIAQRNPGWFAAWEAVDPDTLGELHTRYHLRRVGTFPVSGDYARPSLLVYQLEPLSEPETGIILKTTYFKGYRRPAVLP